METVQAWESGDLNFTYDWLVKKPSARSLYLWALVYDFLSDKEQLSILTYPKEIKTIASCDMFVDKRAQNYLKRGPGTGM